MLYKLIFKQEAIITIGLSVFWLICSCFFDFYLGIPSAGFVMHPKVELVVLYLLMAVTSFFLNKVLQATKLVGNNDYSVMFLAAALMSALGYSIISFQFVTGFLTSLILISKIQGGFNKPETIFSEFEMGIIAGVLAIINSLFIVVLPFTIVALINVKVNTWRGFVALILGFLFTFLLKWSYLLFFNYDRVLSQLFEFQLQAKIFQVPDLTEQLAIAVLLFVFLMSSNYFMRVSTKLSIKLRVFYKVWIWFSLFLLGALLLFENKLSLPQLILCINLPVVVLYKALIDSFSKKMYRELAIVVLLVVAISLKY